MRQPALLISLRPNGPWRFGPGDGGRDRVDGLYRSDRLYSAVTLAMQQLGWLDEWLETTARSSSPAIALSSLFPYQGETLFVPPPATLWPPPPGLVTTPSPVFLSKTRWATARFVPVTVIEAILTCQRLLADQWIPDAESGCLLRRDRPSSSPFRIGLRSGAAVDRLTQSAVHTASSACLEFEAGSGLWAIVRYGSDGAESAWNDRVMAAFRFLADSGFGARRSAGWGHAEAPRFQQGSWPNMILPKAGRASRNGAAAVNGDAKSSFYWLLSLYSPAAADSVDWNSGDYRLTLRGGRIESAAGSGTEKKIVRMVTEGSVVVARSEPIGSAVDVSPDGFPHPVYRSGLALALRLPALELEAEPAPVEIPTEEQALEQTPGEPEEEQVSIEVPAASPELLAEREEKVVAEGTESEPKPAPEEREDEV